ncbi:hypothetical protein [Roseimaritima ulvae]|uniref:PEGA domain-containing protein n=1 Tax=Roseimaritima ulvae TaxID=980254 RepID=A0A5B9QH36_9BACT|nr:hypothetical protein [Roseimaritima ulvae]QEG38427.1 hypothetical protein UC8_03840 [Roseimaritima ulvae]
MFRTLILGLLLVSTTSTATLSYADEHQSDSATASHADYSTLQFYFPPTIANGAPGQAKFAPEVARVYIDNSYVGDLVVNLHGHDPSLRVASGEHAIRVEMSNQRKFDTKIMILGRGSTQLLVVDFNAKSPGDQH